MPPHDLADARVGRVDEGMHPENRRRVDLRFSSAWFLRSDVEMFLWQGTIGEGSTCLDIRDPGQDELVGVLAWMAPHPRDWCPWIGCIVLRADRQRQGFGSEVLRALERLIAAEGWERVRASPLVAQPWAQAFLESLGYTPIEERLDQDKRRCMVMEKLLIAEPGTGPSA